MAKRTEHSFLNHGGLEQVLRTEKPALCNHKCKLHIGAADRRNSHLRPTLILRPCLTPLDELDGPSVVEMKRKEKP